MLVVPGWLALGLAIAAGLTVVFAVLFVAGERLFPTEPRPGGSRMDGEWKRRAEIRDYLDAIGEAYAEDHPVGEHAVAFYLPERDVAITFDGVAFFHIDGTETYAVLVEHEMPGAHLGARLPFETPEVEHEDPTAPGPVEGEPSVESAFAALGLEPDADEAAVRDAYRERVKEVHPDHGGDEEAFRRVQEAYTAARQAAAGS